MEPGNFLSAFFWAVIPAVILIAVIYWLDRFEKEPVRLLAVALGFGALLAPVVAVLVQSALDVPTSMAVQTLVPESRLNVTSPLVEEIVRGLAIFAVIYLVTYEIDSLLDGVIYGGIVGVGFGMAANFVAIMQTPSLGQDITPSLFAAMVSGLNHVFYGAVIGLAAAYGWLAGMGGRAVVTSDVAVGLDTPPPAERRGSIGTLAAGAGVGTVLAILFHLLHDYLPSWVSADAVGGSTNAIAALLADAPNILGLIALAVIVTWSLGREGVLVARELEPEVDAGAITAEEYEIVTNSLRRFTVMLTAIFTGGPDWGPRRQLYGLLIELAYRKHHRRKGRIHPGRYRDEAEYRRQIAEARRDLLEATTAAGAR